MLKKQTIFFVGLFVVLFLIYRSIDGQGMRTERRNNLEVGKLAELKRDQIAEIEFEIPESELIIRRQDELDGSWVVSSHSDWPVRSQQIETFLEEFSALDSRGVVGLNPDNYLRFGVEDKSNKIIVKDSSGNPLLRLIRGKRGNDFRSTYARLVDESEVYQLSVNLDSVAPEQSRQWIKPALFSYIPEKVNRIYIVYGTDEIEFKRNILSEEDDDELPSSWDWEIEKPYQQLAINEMVDSLAATVAGLNIYDVHRPGPGDNYDFESANQRFWFELADGTREEFTIGRIHDPSSRYLRHDSGRSSEVFLLANWVVDSIFNKQPADYRRLPVSTEEAQSLEENDQQDQQPDSEEVVLSVEPEAE